jgi:hypothetical protein
MGEAMTTHIQSEDNPADISSKLMPEGEKHNPIVSNIFIGLDVQPIMDLTFSF